MQIAAALGKERLAGKQGPEEAPPRPRSGGSTAVVLDGLMRALLHGLPAPPAPRSRSGPSRRSSRFPRSGRSCQAWIHGTGRSRRIQQRQSFRLRQSKRRTSRRRYEVDFPARRQPIALPPICSIDSGHLDSPMASSIPGAVWIAGERPEAGPATVRIDGSRFRFLPSPFVWSWSTSLLQPKPRPLLRSQHAWLPPRPRPGGLLRSGAPPDRSTSS